MADEELKCDECRQSITENCYVRKGMKVDVICKACFKTVGLKYMDIVPELAAKH